MESIIEEGADALEKDGEGASFDSGIYLCALPFERSIMRSQTTLQR